MWTKVIFCRKLTFIREEANHPEQMKTVLLIEDDLDLRENTTELLELKGYNVLVASNGQEGVERAKEAQPDIIVCDVRMPIMDGIEVIETLKSDPATKDIPFIFCTASAQEHEVLLGKQAGAALYITKPYDQEVLYSAIEDLTS